MKKILKKSILIFSLFLGFGSNAQVISQDSLALVDLYNSTNGASWSNNANWLLGPVSTWEGITVVGERVKDVRLFSNNLSGTLPSSIGDLTEMRLLHLSDNNISGSIPSTISSCAYLSRIYLDRNNLSGAIPNVFGGLSLLREVWFNRNNFTGNIPSSIFINSTLRIIALDHNSLNGSIPSFSSLNNLEQLYLNSNSLTGSIPSDINTSVNLISLYLDSNSIDGSIPGTITSLSSLEAFGAANNLLEGSIPDFGSMVSFKWLIVGDNNLSAFNGLSASGTYEYSGVQNNSLDFSDLEPVYANSPAAFDYLDQDSIGVSYDTTVSYLGTITLTATHISPNNNYQWKRDGANIIGANNSTYIINNAHNHHDGAYTCDITNTVVTGLTIHQRPINLLVNEYFSECGNYRIENVIIPSSGQTFYLKMWSKSIVPTGIIGMDICFNYDASEVVPTGNLVYGSVFHGGVASHVGKKVKFNNVAGEMNIGLYYDADAPVNKEFTGNGTIIYVQFQSQSNSSNVSSVEFCGVDEGYETSVESYCRPILRSVKPNSFNNNFKQAMTPLALEGKLKFWGLSGNDRKLSYDSNIPNKYVPTYSWTADANCDTVPVSTLPDKYSRFFLNLNSEPKIIIERDIEGDFNNNSNCSDVSGWIKYDDAAVIMDIATKSSSFTPSVHQMIASDVNMDGLIRSNDATLLFRRYSERICEFPQAWNYTNGTPNGAGISKDWLFFSEEELISNSTFTIDGQYPNSSGNGFSRDNVPQLNNCIDRPVTGASSIRVVYHAVLLGDATGNWTRSAGGILRPGQSGDDLVISNANVKVLEYPTKENPYLLINISDDTYLNSDSYLYNVYGQLISTERIDQNIVKIDFRKNSPGLYILSLQKGENASAIKIMF